MNNPNNNRESNAVFARKATKGPSKDGSKQITKLFLNNESVEAIIAGLQNSLQNAQDGVSITIIEGEGAKGPYTMIASDGLEDRGYKKPEQPYQGEKKSYTDKTQVNGQADRPQAQGGYKPKTPGYAKSFNK
jgi:hypothetical protein